jgi:hypothetical protein
MEKVKKIFRYMYWLGAKVHYKRFEEDGENGVFLLTNIIGFIIIDILCLLRLFFYNKDYETNSLNKIIIGGCALLLYYIVGRIFKGIPIKENQEFKNISDKTRRFHTVLLYILWFFLFALMIIIVNLSASV